MSITQQTFDGLAFPVARVRYAGPTDSHGGRYNASIRRDSERTYRATRSYQHEERGGAAQAIHAATLALAKCLADIDPDLGTGAKPADYIAVPGDFDANTYVFTFVPRYFFEE